MAIPKKIINYLEKQGAKFEEVSHKKVFTAFDKAQTLKVPEKIIGKTLLVKLLPEKNSYAAILVGANKNLDLPKIVRTINIERKRMKGKQVGKIEFVKEAWMKKTFKGIKLGSVPPFGAIWKLPTIADKTLLKEAKIIVNGGDWTKSIKITPAALKKAVPDLIMGNISKPKSKIKNPHFVKTPRGRQKSK